MIKNYLSLLSGRFVGDLATFLLFVVLSRHFGEEGIGQYSFATMVGGVALVLSDFGLRTYTLREVGRHRHRAKDRYWHIIATWLLNSALVFTCLVPLVLLMPISEEAKWILILICASQLFLCILGGLSRFYVAHERMVLGALHETIAAWLVALGAIGVTLAGGQLVAVSAVIALAYLVAAICAAVLAFRYFQITPGGFSLRVYGQRLRQALPFALRQLLRQLSLRMDILLLGVLLGPVAVGAYAVAYRLVYLLYVTFNLVGIAILPGASRLFKDSREDFVFLARRALGVVVLLSLPSAVGLMLVAPAMIELFYGPAFETSIGLLQGLAVLIALFPVTVVLQNLLDSSDRQVRTMISEAVGAAVGIVAHATLISLFGLNGAVAAAITTELAILTAAGYGFRDLISWPNFAARLGIAALGSTAIVLLFLALPAVSVFVLMPLAMIVYAAIVLCFSEVRKQDLGALMELARKRRAGEQGAGAR